MPVPPKKKPPIDIKDRHSILINEFIRQADSAKLPNPAFVALQDGVGDVDRQNIDYVFKEHRQSAEIDLTGSNLKSEGVSPLYDRKILNELIDDNWGLTTELFSGGDRITEEKLIIYERIARGLFQHIESTQFIVAS